MVQNLEQGKYSEEQKTKILKIMANDRLQYDREYKAHIKLMNAFLTLVTYIIVIIGAGVLLLLKKEKDIRKDYGDSLKKITIT